MAYLSSHPATFALLVHALVKSVRLTTVSIIHLQLHPMPPSPLLQPLQLPYGLASARGIVCYSSEQIDVLVYRGFKVRHPTSVHLQQCRYKGGRYNSRGGREAQRQGGRNSS